MASFSLIRVDHRLVHGQIITRWMKQIKANRIVIIDDALSGDAFMCNIYSMAAPPGVKVEISTIDDACNRWKKDMLGSGYLLVLFRNVNTALEAFEKGFPIQEVQIGGTKGDPGKKNVCKGITIDKQEFDNLMTMHNKGVNVYFHMVPEDKRVSFESLVKKPPF